MFRAATEYALEEKLPLIYLAANAGARVGLAQEVKQCLQVTLCAVTAATLSLYRHLLMSTDRLSCCQFGYSGCAPYMDFVSIASRPALEFSIVHAQILLVAKDCMSLSQPALVMQVEWNNSRDPTKGFKYLFLSDADYTSIAARADTAVLKAEPFFAENGAYAAASVIKPAIGRDSGYTS